MSQFTWRYHPTLFGLLAAGILAGLAGCGSLPKDDVKAQSGQGQQDSPAAVDVAIARTTLLQQDQPYTGTTQPYREVSLRSRIEGQLLDLAVDVGDRVSQGETVGRLDDGVLTAAVVEAQAEVAARQSDVAQAQAEVSNARTLTEDARLKLQQAQSDLNRLEQLFREGAIPEQQVETARTAVGTARQALRSTQEQVRTRQQAAVAVQRRVTAQQAIVAQNRERQSYTVLTSPVTGFVLQRILEPGNLAQPGSEVLRLGDFSQVEVAVPVSERELGTIRVGQPVQVKLDAFPDRQFGGRVTRVSPATAGTARLTPVEVTLPNPDGQIGGGLLARVNFTQQARQRVVIPESALQTNQDRRSRQANRGNPANAGNQERSGQPPQEGRQNRGEGGNPGKGQNQGDRPQPERKSGTVFVLNTTGEKPIVQAKQVSLGKRQDGRVEVVSGLRVGDRFVVRSSKALKDGATVRLSVLSEGGGQKDEG